ncbi:carbohydrate ABC transporter permease [Paenibacillus xerothermodurans]|uniref:Sugar ABC transporter permease n=1 Tax=Paenibacillus xerothermodurans TaxID=1977292 RepID=A0A2W1P4U4_PAEXE|nr:sugar ABC transporter permease [Paenibacillus xerothermodurans]PZE22178.1 sugar ABC transporter permease [Paenibacillus xerothermodurans]
MKIADHYTGRSALQKQSVSWLPYYFLLPSIILILLINFYPFLSGLVYSVQNGTLLKPGEFIGIHNYAKLLTMPDFWHALYFSSVFAVFSVIGSYVIGLGFAILLNKDIIGRGFFRVALLVPWILPSVVSIVGWRWLIGDQNGLFNTILVGFGFEPVLFLGTEGWAMFSVIMIKVWRSFPFMMISLLAGLQTINQELYESAHMDGAGRWQSFWYITLPQLRMITVVCWILMTIWCFNDFDTIWLLTQGGPANATENLIILAYKYTFSKNAVGIGSAISIVSLVILMALAVLLLKKQEQE